MGNAFEGFSGHMLELTLFLFLGSLVCWELGRAVGRRRAAVDPTGWQSGTGVIEGAAFGLLGLILGFTFSGAAGRLDVRRQLVVEEANAVGTAYLRIDLVPESAQPALRDAFRRYLDTRIAAYAAVPDMQRAIAGLDAATALQGDIWKLAVEASRNDPGASRLLLPAINDMIDITTVRTTVAKTHAPAFFFMLISFLVLVSGLLAGYAMAASRNRNWLHGLAFAGMLTAVVYVVVDMDYPRLGFIRIDGYDQVLRDARIAMK